MTVDCDVLCADGGTRTAAITGAWVAIAVAVNKLKAQGIIPPDAAVLGEPVAATSVGIIDGQARLDLPYDEDSVAAVDMNVVATQKGQLIEVQGTAEGEPFSRDQLTELLDLAMAGISELASAQLGALEAVP